VQISPLNPLKENLIGLSVSFNYLIFHTLETYTIFNAFSLNKPKNSDPYYEQGSRKRSSMIIFIDLLLTRNPQNKPLIPDIFAELLR